MNHGLVDKKASGRTICGHAISMGRSPSLIIRELLAKEYVEKNAQGVVLNQWEVAEFEKGIEIEY